MKVGASAGRGLWCGGGRQVGRWWQCAKIKINLFGKILLSLAGIGNVFPTLELIDPPLCGTWLGCNYIFLKQIQLLT